MIARIRRGNDFKHIWPITWNGQPEDFSDATDITLTAKVYGQVKTLTEGVDYHIDGGTVMIDFTPSICDITGTYTIELNYIKPSAEFIDGDRRSAVDVQAFQIVNTSAEANATEGVSLPSEALAIYALKYEDLSPENIAELQRPATDAAASVSELEQTVSDNEALRVDAEQGRVDTEFLRVGAESARSDAEGLRNANEIARIEAEGIRDANETDRINAESDRVDAEDLRDQAEVAREEAEGLRQTNTATAIQNAGDATTAANTATGLANNAATAATTAAGDANDAASAANTAAGLADTARTELTTAVNTKLGEADGKISEMNTTLSTYDGRVTQMEADIDQLAGDVSDSTEKAGAASLAELNARLLALEKIVSATITHKLEVTKEFNVWGRTNLILTGSGAATFAPDFVGQKYIDTAGGNVYVAVGVATAGNWKLV